MGIEVLAPAGSEEAVIAAVNSGADAVYLGSKVLNARRNASNFDHEKLKEIVQFCHMRGVKVYLTLNTIAFDTELELCKEEIIHAAKAGIDALIVQDLGVAELARTIAPQMHLHGSTQMTVHTLNGAYYLKKLGFTRVVLARELSKQEIETITKNCGIETEVFVHGALCMCVSGQCYLSSVIGSRSGNRGLCAQPCRLPFSTDNSKGRYDLSLKDLSIAKQALELKDIGVTSLKIEGRMKRPEYVAASVSVVREALNGTLDEELYENLCKVFSRSGFTSGYYDHKMGKEMFGIRSKEDVLSSNSVLKGLKTLYKDEYKRLPVNLKFSLMKDKPCVLTAEDGENSITVLGDIPETAMNKSADDEQIRKNLIKTGGTPFYTNNIEIEYDDGLAIAAKSINQLRREALETLMQKRGQVKEMKINDISFDFPKLLNIKIPTLRARFFKFSQIPIGKIEKLEKIILPLEEAVHLTDHELALIQEKLIVELPRAMFDCEEDVAKMVLTLKERNATDFMAMNLAHIELLQKFNLTIHGGYSLNIVNSLALKSLAQQQVKDTVLSFEIDLLKAKQLGDFLNCGILAYGYLPLMLTRNCPIKNTSSCAECKRGFHGITDRLNNTFPIVCTKVKEQSVYSELFNCTPLYLADRLNELHGFSFLLLYFTKETTTEADCMIDKYLNGGAKIEPLTRGLYYRGVE